jgi:hypothetical protein
MRLERWSGFVFATAVLAMTALPLAADEVSLSEDGFADFDEAGFVFSISR